MIQYFRYSGFKCLNQKEIDGFNVNLVRENSSHGYILEIDLEDPDGEHGLHDYIYIFVVCCRDIVAIFQINTA